MLGIWLGSLAGGAFAPLPEGLFRYQDGNYPVLHAVAEALMGALSLTAGSGLWRRHRWGRGLALLAIGMPGYSTINSSGWALTNGPALLAPMLATLRLALLAVLYLLRGPSREK